MKMLNKLLLLLLLLIAKNAKCSQTDSLSFYIDKLNWESFKITPNYATVSLSFDDNSQKIISILQNHRDKRTTLLNYINQAEKAVAIHAILTKVYENKKFELFPTTDFKKGPSGEEIYSEIIGETFSLNGLSWEFRYQNNTPSSYYISDEAIKIIRRYWLKKFNMRL